MPAISIIVPVYRAEAHLERCVRSILAQRFADFELILVDDGSPDTCPLLCDAWARSDPRIRVLHRENGGAGAARNAGLRIATGDFIGFVDSDDWIQPEMYARMHALITEVGADMCLCDYRCVTRENERPPRSGRPEVELLDRSGYLDRFFRVHGEKNSYGVWLGLYSREMLAGFSFAEGRTCEDVLACFDFATRSRRTVRTSEPLYCYFQNPTGITHTFDRRKADLLLAWDEVGERLGDDSPAYEYAWRMNRARACMTLLTQMLLHGYDRGDPALRDMKRDLKRQLRASWWELMRWRMPLSRKILLCVVAIA